MSQSAVENVAGCDLFAGLSRSDIDAILACGAAVSFQTGQVIFEESSVNSDLYVILDGRVCVEIDAPSASGDGNEHLQLALLRTGEVFGEIAFLKGKRRSARVCALDDVSVLQLDGTKLTSLFESNPSLGYHAMRNLATILAQRVVDVNFKWRQDRGGAARPT
jgi:CRP/FNR family transcriptional regulator, cyclic AMP receptor protein